MEGLLIAEQLRAIAPLLPSERLSWRFPDPHAFVLPLERGAVWLYVKPPHARLAYRTEMPPPGPPQSGFQELLVARAAGTLLAAEQLKLDRVVEFRFAAATGFVETAACVLIAELTGRNCNLILTDSEGKILGVAREVGSDINRYRQLRPGLRYQPPPPYDKLDPRGAPRDALGRVLAGRTLGGLRKVVDGLGPDLTTTLSAASGLPPDRNLSEAEVARVVPVLERLVAEPSRVVAEALELPDIETLRRGERRAALVQSLRQTLDKQRQVVKKRLEDIDRAREAAREADELRRQADVLMAHVHQVPPQASEVTLTDFEGEALYLTLEPKKGAVGNAQSRYERAKKREVRAVQAEAREPELRAELEELEGPLERLDTLGDEELEALIDEYGSQPKTQPRTQPGVRYTSPQGLSVLVGRNSKENDIITFKMARSRDVWLHAQGYPGSHVLIRAESKEVPYETILYAAQLAAAYSKAGQSDNVPVDYTLRKNVWKPKGALPGAVHFSQQKTVYVTPSRRPDQD